MYKLICRRVWDWTGEESFIIKPTGRWKIASLSERGESHTLWIEHKGWFFKQWIPEDDIKIIMIPNETINECSSQPKRYGIYYICGNRPKTEYFSIGFNPERLKPRPPGEE